MWQNKKNSPQVEEEAPPEKVDENEGKGVPPTINIDSRIYKR